MTDTPTPRAPRKRNRLKAYGITFIPVPTARKRADGWTPERQQRFLAALYACGIVAGAAEAVGMSAATAYRLRRRAGGESFAKAWDTLLREARGRALDEAIAYSLTTGFVPRAYRGLFAGRGAALDSRMLIAALNASGVANRLSAGAAASNRKEQFHSG